MTLGRCPLSIFCSRDTPPANQPSLSPEQTESFETLELQNGLNAPPETEIDVSRILAHRGTSLIRKRIPLDPTVGLFPGSKGGPRRVVVFSLARYPCKPAKHLRVVDLEAWTQSVYKVVLQKSIPAQIRQLILDISNHEG